MTHWIRQLFRTTPTSPVVKARRTTLGLQRLEERETPATFIVTTTDDSGPGSLRKAVDLANTTAGEDTITFADGLGPVKLTTAELVLTDAATTTISGPIGGTQVVTRSTAGGTPLFRIFDVASGKSAVFNNLTISNGNVLSSGGGIFNAGTLTITNSTISGNTTDLAGNGGGILNDGTLTITNSTVSGNSTIDSGSGIFNAGTMTVTNSTISGNTANSKGGGIDNFFGTMTVTNSTISGNTANSGGGGINNRGTMTVTDSTVSGNNSSFGGGILSNGTLTVANSTISGNVAAADSGGIFNSGNLAVTTSTISGNTSKGAAGGLGNSGLATVTNSTISGNAATGAAGGLGNTGLATVTNSTISGNTANSSGGGGVYVVGSGAATLTNVTITGNRSDNDNSGSDMGGGLFRNDGRISITLNNTLIAGNFRGTGTTRDDVIGAVEATSANNLIGDGTGLTGITNGSQGNLIGTAGTPINPLLQPLANNGGVTFTHALGQNSPALGAGSASVTNYSVFDQRGSARDVAGGASPDIGAYEVNHPLAPVGVPTTLGGMFQPKPSASANEAFVKGLYRSTLLRAPDAAGLAGWLSQLAGGTSRSTVANGFVNSIENRRNQVTFFYRYFLSREPDTAGLNGWVDILRGGTDEGQVMTGFILSNEFSGQNNNSQFVNLMYYALLSRQADTAGFNGWVNALNAGQSRGVVVNAFLRSEEGLNRVIDSLFQTYLKRYGVAGDLTLYRTFLNTNTFGQGATLILSSAEFFTNAGNNLS